MKKRKIVHEKKTLYLMALLYVLAGVNHIVNPEFYLPIMPSYVPWHAELVLISGIIEIILGLLLLYPATRTTAAWLIILLLIAVFPANWQMAHDFYLQDHPYLWLAIVRLPLQIVLIWWAWLYTKTVKKRL